MIKEEDFCSKTLLTLVARGSAIITELHRLTELVPPPFKIFKRPTGCKSESSVDDLICDFSYFKNSDMFEAKIESNKKLQRADEEFCETHIDLLTRFYLTFESVHRYSSDLNSFVFELEDDVYVGQSLDRLLSDNENRQLICEAYFLLGYMLLTCDNNFEGELRERLIVSYYRYSSYKSSPGTNLEDTCNLLRSTDYRSVEQATSRDHSNYHRPKGYPEQYFARVGVNKTVVDLLIAKLQTVDLYNQTNLTFQHPDHRSTALGQQAAILYVLLYFCPEILDSNRARMREICNRFFCDNWIISLHLGHLINLLEAWQPYSAASESLSQLHETGSISSLVGQINLKYSKVSEALEDYLQEGWLSEQTVLEHHSRILNQIREANVLLKWILLHTQWQDHWLLKSSKLTHSVVVKDLKPSNKLMYKFLQDLAILEKKFSSIYSLLLDNKETNVKENKTKAMDMLVELIEMFDSSLTTKPVRWIQPGSNSRLIIQLNESKQNLESINLEVKENNQAVRDSVIKLIYQLESAQESYSDDKNLQVVQLFKGCRESLLRIVQCLSVPEDMKVLLHSIGDFSYAWRLMDQTFTCHMQKNIKDDPLKVYTIEATFIKLASAFDQCLIRIQQVNSHADLISVSQYYSTKLVSYIRDVLQIIPATILELVSSITSIQTEYVMNELPTRIPLENLKEYSLPEKRFQMLELTHKVSHYAESLLMMQDTTIGLIRVNSKQLLEDGFRRELVKRMSDSIQEMMPFTGQNENSIQVKAQNLLQKLNKLVVVMTGYKRSFEYIQDYLFIYGQRMWQEELNRLIKFNVEQAIEVLLGTLGGDTTQSHDEEDYFKMVNNNNSIDFQKSQYQQRRAPIPVYSSDPLESSFLVRLLEELLLVTDPKLTIYDEQMSAWYEQNGRNKVLDLKVLELIGSSLGVGGLNGLDQLTATLVLVELKRLDAHIQNLTISDLKTIKETMELLEEKKIKGFASASAKMVPYGGRVTNQLLRLGQLQALRSNIKLVLASLCRYEARNLYNCLETLDGALLATLRSRQNLDKLVDKRLSSSQQQQSSNSDNINYELGETNISHGKDSQAQELLEESQLTFELANHLDWIGLSEPMGKIYTLSLGGSYEINTLINLLFLVLLEQCSKFQFSPSIAGFLPKLQKSFRRSFYEGNSINGEGDGQPFFYGLVTLINHLEPEISLAREENSYHLGSMEPLVKLLSKMGAYVRSHLRDDSQKSANKLGNSLSLEVSNVIMSMIELIRLTAQRSPMGFQAANELLKQATQLPDFLLDTFQFTLCQLRQRPN